MFGKRFFGRFWGLLAAGLLIAAVFAPVSAWATDNDPYPTVPQTDPVTTTVQAQVAGQSASASSSLPVTGGDIAGLVAIGGGLVVVGLGLRRFRTQRSNV